jgi:hypothetical protein
MGADAKSSARPRSSGTDIGKTMRYIGIFTFVLLLVLAIGCEEKDRYTLRFSHNLHVVEMEIACTDCHGEVTEGEAAKPDHDSCIMCHEDLIDADEISEDTCGTCHVEKDLEAIGMGPKPKKVTRGVFMHTAALEGKCASCHGNLLAEGAERVPVLTRSRVIDMRETGHAMNLECTDCHEYLDPDWMPENHLKGWTRRHGVLAQEEDAVCSACHHDTACRECHQSQQPASHNNLWRLRTHGIEATWDRKRCQTCHQDDFCVACHSEMEPRSHNALWTGGRIPRHCTVCHEPGQNCAVCHEREAPSIHTEVWPSFHQGIPNVENCFRSGCHAQGVIPNP